MTSFKGFLFSSICRFLCCHTIALPRQNTENAWYHKIIQSSFIDPKENTLNILLRKSHKIAPSETWTKKAVFSSRIFLILVITTNVKKSGSGKTSFCTPISISIATCYMKKPQIIYTNLPRAPCFLSHIKCFSWPMPP